ncbi:hypothetical protein OK349_09225 [Sphingomonas sp. BT-65]|uniref:hypothetical protein n=1 Tax=Sphingomonas sp. BT-65 TaxID=2989821 RepID=UPI002236ACF3|nr:hypothetical protein [Sphingomonas sp. BT-65]MCW4461889.1 hypothetical protein [Sphingomonas sp. BT-65]
MIDLLEYARFHYLSEWVALTVLLAAILFLNRLVGLRYVNALLLAQIIFVFNAIPVIAGFVDGYLPIDRVVHFFLTETILMIATCAVYTFIVRRGMAQNERIAAFFTGAVPYLLIVVGAGLAVFTYMVTPQDGTSRIMYQTNYWYSLVKPISAIIGPLSYFGAFLLLTVHRQRVPAYGLLIVSVLGGVASGSKGAFVTQALLAFLMVRDLGLTGMFRVALTDVALGAAGLAAGVALSLQRLRLDVSHLWDRIMLYGEPTLLTYFAPDSTAACNNLSLLAKMHRGLARMLGDPGALNIDTLFGYAWTIQYVGVNTFTGPNARYSAYLTCNFPGWLVLFGLIITCLYFFLVVTTTRLADRTRLFYPAIYSFLIFSISSIGQDFNILMQDISFLLGMVAVMIILPRVWASDGRSMGLEAGRS